MDPTNPSRRARRIAFIICAALFLSALAFVVAGYRELHHWLFLATTFSNLMLAGYFV